MTEANPAIEKLTDADSTASRRNFIKGSSMLLAGAMPQPLPLALPKQVAMPRRLKLGLIGCGSRGTALAIQGLNVTNVQLVAVADVFEDRIQQSMRAIRSRVRDQVASDCQRFSGFDGYQRLLGSDVDVVILAAPPGFRPLHFAAAVASGKHVFAEKPIAVDAPGVRSFMANNQLALDQQLAVMVGFQRRNSALYRATIEQLQSGAIGEISFCRAYWNQNSTWVRPRSSNQRELEYQLRNWQHFNWLGGDHIVEQHVHNLDVINWLLNSHPEKAQGAGSRQIRSGSDSGELNGHHVVEFSYRGGVKLLSMCRQMSNCWNAVGEFAHGSKGWADIGNGKIYDSSNQLIWENSFRDSESNGIQTLLSAVQNGDCPNEGNSAAISTMTAVMGRMATYTGKEMTWNQCINSPQPLADLNSIRSLADSPPAEKFAGLYCF